MVGTILFSLGQNSTPPFFYSATFDDWFLSGCLEKLKKAASPVSRTIQTRNHSCHGLTNKPTMPVEPLVCGDGEPNLAMTSSRISPGGNSLGSRSVAVRMNV